VGCIAADGIAFLMADWTSGRRLAQSWGWPGVVVMLRGQVTTRDLLTAKGTARHGSAR
jgi:hypothetical protein